jgi:tRNA modification GTPase
LVVDVSQPLTDVDWAIRDLIDGRPAILVQNKVDLLQSRGRSRGSLLEDSTAISVSALTGEGLDKLEDAILATVLSGHVVPSEAPMVTSPRHREALQQAHAHVEAAHASYQDGQWADLIAIDLAAAVNVLGQITGQTASEDLIETIFSSFCVGK